VFGGLRRLTENVRAQADAQRFYTEAAYLTLTTNVVNAAVQAAMLRDQIAATEEIIRFSRDLLQILRRQESLGEIGRGDVAAQAALLAQAQQSLPPLEKQLAQTEDLLADLTGRFASQAPADDLRLANLTLPRDLPLSLPSKLVEQRPDIRAAEANLHAAGAQVGVAIAERLPSFALAADAGGEATNIAQMFDNGNAFWVLSGTVSQTIFDAGALKHKQRAAEAAFSEAKAQYRSTVLSAFQNVAVVLNAEQTEQQALVARLQAQANRLADTTALFQALGGGWWNRAETTDGPR
jgi:NodT family efflux transporter outer membrane factor (OMF) lipoprotein